MKYVLPLALALAATPAFAADNSMKGKMYAGVSLSHHEIDSPFGADDADAAGYSIYGGIDLKNSIEGLITAAELGYSDTEDFYKGQHDTDINGLWIAGVLEKSLPEINPKLSALGRIGLDFGDDDGLFLGAGLGFRATDALGLRAEFINKDASGLYQVSAQIHF